MLLAGHSSSAGGDLNSDAPTSQGQVTGVTASWKARLRRFLKRPTADERAAELRQQGLLNEQEYRATRMFRVSGFRDEGFHYFFLLEDSTVLHLQGPYLRGYGSPAADIKAPPDQVFPSTSFVLGRHARTGEVVNLRPTGEFLPPEATFFPFAPGYVPPEDGDLITDASYTEILKNEGRVPKPFVYAGTDIPVRVGDRVTVRSWFGLGRKRPGVVSYLPGQSPVHSQMEAPDFSQWAITLDNSHSLIWAYVPTQLRPSRSIEFLERGVLTEQLLPDPDDF